MSERVRFLKDEGNLVLLFSLEYMNFCLIPDVKVADRDPVFQSVHTLLMILYEKDCRRSFTPVNHWLIR